MNPDQFKQSVAGKCILTSEGYYAFIPYTLPPKLTLEWKWVSLLSDADRALSELSGIARQLPNPKLLTAPYTRKEAVLSSRIEGTQASISDLLLYEAEDSTSPNTSDVQEVKNYVTATYYGIKRLSSLPISRRLIQEVHEKLMKDVRGNHATPGEFRRSQNWIGPPGCSLKDATYVPPPVSELENTIGEWEKYLHSENGEPTLIKCALLHYQFEAIHPFLDGNGRVGRLLITLFLAEKGYLTQPILYLSSFFEKYRDEYYALLLNVSQKGDWNSWIEYFLRGVAQQSKEAIENANRIVNLQKKYRETLHSHKKRIPQTALKLIDHLFVNPFISASKIAKDWDMDFPAIMRGVQKLVELGIIKEITGNRRNRLFLAESLIKILDPEWK